MSFAECTQYLSACPHGKLPDFNFPSDTRGVSYFAVSDTSKYYIPRFTSAATLTHNSVLHRNASYQVYNPLYPEVNENMARTRITIRLPYAGIKVTIGREANRKSEIDKTREVGVNKRRAEGKSSDCTR